MLHWFANELSIWRIQLLLELSYKYEYQGQALLGACSGHVVISCCTSEKVCMQACAAVEAASIGCSAS